MPFVDLQPVSAKDRITFSQRKDGQHGVTLAFSAIAAKRNKITKDTKAKVQLDLESNPRQLMVVLGDGPFRFTERKGDAYTLSLPRLSADLPLLPAKAAVEFDENETTNSIIIDLPMAWQRPRPSSGYVESKDNGARIPSIAAHKPGGAKGRF